MHFNYTNSTNEADLLRSEDGIFASRIVHHDRYAYHPRRPIRVGLRAFGPNPRTDYCEPKREDRVVSRISCGIDHELDVGCDRQILSELDTKDISQDSIETKHGVTMINGD